MDCMDALLFKSSHRLFHGFRKCHSIDFITTQSTSTCSKSAIAMRKASHSTLNPTVIGPNFNGFYFSDFTFAPT
jgi:hypothetical protein